MPINDPKAYLHSLLTIPELSLANLNQLLIYCGHDFERAFKASRSDLLAAGLPEKNAFIVANKKSCIDPIAAFVPLTKNSIASISYVDEEFPTLLHEIPYKPILLYYKGQKIARDELCVAVVGTRKITEYGKSVTASITGPLARHRITIVSGLAYGVDGVAHQSTLAVGGRTIAVVASGLLDDDIYPKAHSKLARDIIHSGGTLVSEYPPGTPALKQHFIARNRIISGLSMGTIVTECPDKSGALVTARFALEQNRSVYAVPGSILETNAQGPNNLIKSGAIPVCDAEDILRDLHIDIVPYTTTTLELSHTERQILELCLHTGISTHELSKKLNIPPAEIFTALTFLEMKGAISRGYGDQYRKTAGA